MMYWSLVAIVLGVLGFVVLAALTGMAIGIQPRGGVGRAQAADVMMMLPMLLGLVLLLTLLIYFIGQCMCCAVPAESQARSFAVGSLISTVLVGLTYAGLIAWLVAVSGQAFGGRPAAFLPFGQGMGLGLLLMLLLILGLVLVAHILFITFLKTVARFLGNDSLARSANAYLILYVVLVAWQVLANVIQVVVVGMKPRAPEPSFVMAGIACITLVLALAVFIWYLVLLSRTRDTIKRAMMPPMYD
jgi:hypothetical protein